MWELPFLLEEGCSFPVHGTQCPGQQLRNRLERLSGYCGAQWSSVLHGRTQLLREHLCGRLKWAPAHHSSWETAGRSARIVPLALQEGQKNSQRSTLGTAPGVLSPHIQARLLEIPEDALLGARNPDSYTKVRMYLSDHWGGGIRNSWKAVTFSNHKLRKDWQWGTWEAFLECWIEHQRIERILNLPPQFS